MPSNSLKKLLAAFLACTCFSFIPAAAQEQRDRVITRITLPNEPVDGLEAEVGGRAIKLNSVFTAGRGWLNGLKVKARNISERPIVFAEVQIDVPKSGTMEYPLGIPLRYGQLPPVESADSSGQKSVPHDKIFKLILSDQAFETAMGFLAEHRVTEIVEVKMSHLMIVFDDGTAWNDGSLLRRDPAHPYRWKSAGNRGSSPLEQRPKRSVISGLTGLPPYRRRPMM